MRVEEAPGRLVVIDPPFAGVAWALAALCLLLLVFAWYLRGSPQAGRAWVFLLLAVPPAMGAVALGGGWTEMVFAPHQLEIHQVRAFVLRTTRTVPLEQVEQAMIGRARKTSGLVLRFRSGEEFIPGSFSDRGGYRPAMEAINGFLARHRR
jgi:hypothetical protein